MDRKELIKNLNTSHFKFAIIKMNGEIGIAFILGENLSNTWQSGDDIVFWTKGEHTIIPDDFKFIKFIKGD